MNDPYWTLWATPTRRTRQAELDELARLEYPREDPHWLLASVPVLSGSTPSRPAPRRRAKRQPDHEPVTGGGGHGPEAGACEHPRRAVV
jgi:hypothetical protein